MSTKIVLLVLVVIVGTSAQRILSVSTGVSCLSIPTNGETFDCNQDPGLFQTTTMSILVDPNAAGPGSTSTFDVELTSLPQPGNTQEGTADTCTDPDVNGFCTASTTASITITSTPPVISYSLIPDYQSVPYAYFVNTQTIANNPSKLPPTTSVQLTSLRVIDSVAQNINQLSNGTYRAYAWATNATKFFKCGFDSYPYSRLYPGPPPALDTAQQRPLAPLVAFNNLAVGQTTIDNVKYVQATWTKVGSKGSKDDTAYTTSTFVSSAPVCSVYTIQPRAQVAGRVSVTIVTADAVRVLNLTNIGVGSTVSTPENDFLVSIQDLPVPDGFYAPYLSGKVVICGNTTDAIQGFSMVPVGADPASNPWVNIGDSSYRLFTPENINATGQFTNLVDLYTFAYYVNSTTAQAIGPGCSQLGATNDVYGLQSFQALVNNLGARIGKQYTKNDKLTLPLSKIIDGLSGGFTCAPQFSSTYLTLPIVTPCQAVRQMYQGNLNSTFGLSGVLPSFFNRQSPNIWYDKQKMYASLPNNIQYKLLLAFNGVLLQVRGQVAQGEFDPAGSSCVVDQNIQANNASVFVRVCNLSINASSFYVSTTCSAASKLTPVSGTITTPAVPAEDCILQQVPLNIGGVVPPDATCSSTLLPINAELQISNVKTSTITFVCTISDSATPPVINDGDKILTDLLNSLPTPLPDATDVQTDAGYSVVSIILYGFAGLMALIFVVLLVLTIYYCVASQRALSARQQAASRLRDAS